MIKMNLTKKEFKRICKDTVEIETDITANDTVSKILDVPPRFPMTTLWDKYEDYMNRLEKNPNSSRNKENFGYIKYLMRQRNVEIQEIPEEIEKEIIERNTQKIEKENICGIYGYFDSKKGIYVYIGKDSNISINLRDTQHYANDSQQINRILRGDKEGRYEYRVLETIKNASTLELDIAERYWIAYFNTYHYENPEGMNFTKGGETSFGIETEAKIDYDKVNKKINRRYRGERDGISMKKRGIGKNGDTFVLTTNGTQTLKGERAPKFIIMNKRTKGAITSLGDIRKLLKKFKDLNYEDSELKIVERIRNEYEDVLTEFGY